jgi:hypothetical protein
MQSSFVVQALETLKEASENVNSTQNCHWLMFP